MIVQITVDDKYVADIAKVLAPCVYKPTEEKLSHIVTQYLTMNHLSLYGYVRNHQLVGVIGVEHPEANQAIINHISVLEAHRGQRIATKMMDYVIDVLAPKRLIAETDDDAIDFYRRYGFHCHEKDAVQGIVRYRCIYGEE